MGIFDFFDRRKTVYFPCCITYYKFKESFELYKNIFSKLGINFIVLDREKQVCSGIEALEGGYELEARKLARKNFDIFLEEKINKIITNSPNVYKTFLQDYPKFIPDWNLKVINLWELILERLKNKRLIKNIVNEVVTYNDSCYLGRYCKIYDEPREILNILGYEIKEMYNSREDGFCSGSCGQLPLINPKLANKIAKEKILQAKRIGVKKMMVIGFEDYDLLKNNSKDIEILEFSEVLGKALEIEKSVIGMPN